MNKKMTIQNLFRRGLLMLLAIAAMASLMIPRASAVGVPGISSSAYFACYTLSASGRVYAYTDSSLKTKTDGYISCATDECRLIAFTSGAVQVSYPVSGGRRTAWFPRSAFTVFDLTGSGYTAVTASGKVTTFPRASGGSAYGYVAKGDRVVILGTSGSRTQLIYHVGTHYKLAWADTSQVSQYLTGVSSGTAASSGTCVTQQITAKLNQMMNGAYAGGTYRVNTTYRGLYYKEQCKGFAKSVFQNLFGYNIGSTKASPNNYQISIDTAKTRQVGTLTSLSGRSDAELKKLLTQARPGDFIQVRRSHGGSHSMIVLSTSSGGITVYECNVDGANGIRTATYSWASFRSSNAAVGLYTAKDYSLHCCEETGQERKRLLAPDPRGKGAGR